MQQDFPKLNGDEQLKAENDFLKMKIMLEKGGHFGGDENSELPPEVENQFLNNILAFEEQFEKRNTISVFDKIGKPNQFKPVNEIPDFEMEEAWKRLHGYMSDHGINLDVCSPNISMRELYRFATEELFQHETDDINLPGWTTNFIYDEFYPDPIYDNSRLVEQDLLPDIFSKRDLFYEIHYANDGFVFNGHAYNGFDEFNLKISRFKSLFDEIELDECNIVKCHVKEATSNVTGNYKASAKTGNNELDFAGEFKVKLVLADSEYWYFKDITIEGFNAE